MRKEWILVWTAIFAATAVICMMIIPIVAERTAPKLHYGFVTAKGIDKGDAPKGPFSAFLYPGRFTDGRTHYLVEVSRNGQSCWTEVTERQYWDIMIGDQVCRMGVTD